jgi:hypothetical protein
LLPISTELYRTIPPVALVAGLNVHECNAGSGSSPTTLQ